ncbi:MAG: bifunctional YncE family protein/alkaline phosphatase family protein [Holophagales bacterium]|jgi:YVTN family beta-propeller protein|nr:bifunctional YncE family protein/alkaline phosphatase family protein [Holophagales bacterium]
MSRTAFFYFYLLIVAPLIGQQTNKMPLLPSGQGLQPAGHTMAFSGRPIDLALSEDFGLALVKSNRGLIVLDAKDGSQVQFLPFEKMAASMHGIAISPDGAWLTTAWTGLVEAKRDSLGYWSWGRNIPIPSADKKASYPCGLALSKDGKMAFVAMNRHNTLAIVDLENEKVVKEIPVGVAPYGVALSVDEKIAYVTNWGGRRARQGDAVMQSSGTPVVVDERSYPISGTISRVDLESGAVLAEIEVGLHPSQIVANSSGSMLYIANANSDTVAIVETQDFKTLETISIRPDTHLLFGSLPNALSLSSDEKTLLVANGGNNAIAVLELGDAEMKAKTKISGFIPTGWFPSAVAMNGNAIFVANAKGEGSRDESKRENQDNEDVQKWHVKWEKGSVQRIEIPGSESLKSMTAEVKRLGMIPQALRAMERNQNKVKPAPVPNKLGQPSVFQHVIYVIKENRTYDQVFGDIKKGNGDPGLCIFGREVTPNQHALAEQFVLLDNYYCNGIVSADGHQWATQGITTDYQEKAFGEWSRSYDFGTDPLAFAPTPFLWDILLLSGLSFRNYGEFDFPALVPKTATWKDFYNDYLNKTKTVSFEQRINIEPLRYYTCPDYAGWEMQIPDVARMEVFLKELAEFEKKGEMPNLLIVYLPEDHTQGLKEGAPTPRAHVADNDLALGKLVEAVSNSIFWKDTCIFVNEDDPQNGFDHVDGHRSLCLVISPYTKRGKVISSFYNQSSVLHTITRIFGVSAMNQLVSLAPLMDACFTNKPDFTPFKALPNQIPLDEMTPSKASIVSMASTAANTDISPSAVDFIDRILSLDFSVPDAIDDDLLNRTLWHSVKGFGTPYPAHLAGAHGTGLKKKRLVHAK